MNNLVFVDSKFDKNKSKEYNLSIRVSSDGFSFSILDVNKQCLALRRQQMLQKDSESESIHSFKELIRKEELLNLDYQNVNVLWVSNRSILIPQEFYTEQFAFESYQICHQLDSEEEMIANKQQALDAYSVFAIPVKFKEVLQNQFTNPSFYHHSDPFYATALKAEMSDNHPNVFVNIQKSFIHVIIPDQNKKHFINSYSYQEDADLAYHLLHIYKQQKLSPERSKLIVEGLIQEESKLISLLRKYLNQVEVKLLPARFRHRAEIPHKEYNQFINLLNLSECEL